MNGTTPQMQKALDFIEGYIASKGYSPSYREIADALGLRSPSGAYRLVEGLSERGKVSILPRKSRSISVVERRGESA